jgi:hypothetical protein
MYYMLYGDSERIHLVHTVPTVLDFDVRVQKDIQMLDINRKTQYRYLAGTHSISAALRKFNFFKTKCLPCC